MPSVSLNGDSFKKRQQEEVIESRQFLTFLVGAESFAMPIVSIREIIEYGGLTGTVDAGLPAWRDQPAWLGSAGDRPVGPFWPGPHGGGQAHLHHHHGTAAGGQMLLLGVMVDAVSAVLNVNVDDIEPRPTFGAGIRADFIDGMINVSERFIVVLDVPRCCRWMNWPVSWA
jgi:purine-binding chemotaxis protein CheW